MAKLTVYQKKTCVTCKKALAFLEAEGADFDVKDIEKEPPSKDLLAQAVADTNPKASLNPRATLYKENNLGKAVLSKADVLAWMQKDPNLIKRPFIVKAGSKTPYQGFDPETLSEFAGL